MRKHIQLLSFGQLREANVARVKQTGTPTSKDVLADLVSMALSASTNCVAQLHNKHINVEEASEVFAHTLIYLDLLTAEFGIDLGLAIATVFNARSRACSSTVSIQPDGDWRDSRGGRFDNPKYFDHVCSCGSSVGTGGNCCGRDF